MKRRKEKSKGSQIAKKKFFDIERLRKKRKAGKKISLKELIKADLPPAISAKISPLLYIGSAVLLMSLIFMLKETMRDAAPMAFILGALITAYGLWQKFDVLRTGYDELIFKVVDYTSIVPFMGKVTGPTGIILIKKEDESDEEITDGNLYHIAVSGKAKSLPPVDWIVKVYVPRGAAAAQYGDFKYFPVVYGYAIVGDDKTKESTEKSD